ncbi:hypothetical protein DRP53_01420 [candidate division WOR-3 bacterium]|uniref:Glycosyl transferase family 1 domain-containing protein n=1 Tax=candidate division WOR-3 bacterium TaxID=2052148 RepID=A0A660SKW0_UNCW3|nr:MAG: hypothetical protein DRP53_01420 [candidate division WOR-3 bacterium]
MMGMKIAHFLYDDIENPWLGGGGAFRLLELYSRFPKEAKIIVYTGMFPHANRTRIRGGIKFVRLGSGLSYLISRISFIFCSIILSFFIDCDILIEDFSPYSPLFFPIIRRNLSIIIFQNIFGNHFLRTKGLLGIIPWCIEKLYIRVTPVMMTSSLKLAKIIKREKKPNQFVFPVPCGVDTNCFKTLPEEKNYILFLGRLDMYQKGIDVLLRSYSQIKDEIKGIDLIIAGTGKDFKKVRNLITSLGLDNRVRLVGRVEGKEKYELLSQCLFLCMPSRFESWGIVAAEAMACGKPVIATNIEGLDEVVDEKTAIIIPPDDPEALANAMLRLARDKKLRRELGRRAREKAREFDWDKRAQATWEFYKKFMEAAKRR